MQFETLQNLHKDLKNCQSRAMFFGASKDLMQLYKNFDDGKEKPLVDYDDIDHYSRNPYSASHFGASSFCITDGDGANSYRNSKSDFCILDDGTNSNRHTSKSDFCILDDDSSESSSDGFEEVSDSESDEKAEKKSVKTEGLDDKDWTLLEGIELNFEDPEKEKAIKAAEHEKMIEKRYDAFDSIAKMRRV